MNPNFDAYFSLKVNDSSVAQDAEGSLKTRNKHPVVCDEPGTFNARPVEAGIITEHLLQGATASTRMTVRQGCQCLGYTGDTMAYICNYVSIECYPTSFIFLDNLLP